MTDLLTLSGVHTHVGRYHILHGVDFGVAEGKTTMLLGRNGAGKTSTLRTVMGLWQASSGQISLDGQRIEASTTPDIARLGVGYVPESMAVFSDLTVKENLVLAARDGPLDDSRLEWIFGFFPALRKFWLSRAGALSGGQKQMLSIARAIVEPRKLLLIDEPTKGLAPAIVVALIDCFAEIKRRGATILLVEQNFHAASEIGDSVLVMDNGRIVHRGASDDIDAFLAQRIGIVAKARQMFGGTHRGEGAWHGEECNAFSLENLVRVNFLHTAFRDLPQHCRRNLVTDLDHFFPLIRLSRGF